MEYIIDTEADCYKAPEQIEQVMFYLRGYSMLGQKITRCQNCRRQTDMECSLDGRKATYDGFCEEGVE